METWIIIVDKKFKFILNQVVISSNLERTQYCASATHKGVANDQSSPLLSTLTLLVRSNLEEKCISLPLSHHSWKRPLSLSLISLLSSCSSSSSSLLMEISLQIARQFSHTYSFSLNPCTVHVQLQCRSCREFCYTHFFFSQNKTLSVLCKWPPTQTNSCHHDICCDDWSKALEMCDTLSRAHQIWVKAHKKQS